MYIKISMYCAGHNYTEAFIFSAVIFHRTVPQNQKWRLFDKKKRGYFPRDGRLIITDTIQYPRNLSGRVDKFLRTNQEHWNNLPKHTMRPMFPS